MQVCTYLNIVTNSNGIVRIYADGGMVFEIQADYVIQVDYVKSESYVDCDKPAISDTVSKTKKVEEKICPASNQIQGRIMLDESDFTPMSDEEKYRRANWNMQPEAQYDRN